MDQFLHFVLLHALAKLLCVSCLYAAKVYFITSLKCKLWMSITSFSYEHTNTKGNFLQSEEYERVHASDNSTAFNCDFLTAWCIQLPSTVVEYKVPLNTIEPRWYLVKWIGVNALPHKADSIFSFSLFRVQAHVDPYGTINTGTRFVFCRYER